MNIKTIVTAAMLTSLFFGGLCHADAASGLPTGKRQHKPVAITKPIDKATPMLAGAASTGVLQDTRAGYRRCPDGNTMVGPGEKYPEKSTR